MIDYSKLGFASHAAALKLIKEGNGSGTIPATVGLSDEYTRIVIPHGHTSDNLIFRVMLVIPGYPAYSNYFVIPLVVTGLYATPSVDENNLYIEVGQSGFDLPSQNFNYYYRIIIP